MGLAILALVAWQLQSPVVQVTGGDATARNSVRQHELEILADAMVQYQAAHGGAGVSLPAADTEICLTTGPDCDAAHLVDLHYLIGTAGLNSLPADPSGGLTAGGSGYMISQAGGQLRLSAPRAEGGVGIDVTR